jgi:hypothetical protein
MKALLNTGGPGEGRDCGQQMTDVKEHQRLGLGDGGII